MNYAEARPRIRSFDILLFQGRGLISRAIQAVTGSPWSHVALALRLADQDWVLCYESTTLSDIPDLVTGSRVKGVQAVPLSQRLAAYGGSVAWRPVEGRRYPDDETQAVDFLRRYRGVPYERNQVELLCSALDATELGRNQPDASSVFCSELAALLLREVGVLGGEAPANEFTPADFSRTALPFSEGYSAGEIIPLVP